MYVGIDLGKMAQEEVIVEKGGVCSNYAIIQQKS
jgi:hypothetical protein